MTTETSPDRYAEVQQSAEFAGLRKTLRSFVFPMTVAFFLWYALYVLLSAYARGFMGTKLFGNKTRVTFCLPADRRVTKLCGRRSAWNCTPQRVMAP